MHPTAMSTTSALSLSLSCALALGIGIVLHRSCCMLVTTMATNMQDSTFDITKLPMKLWPRLSGIGILDNLISMVILILNSV
jgi:hypothetical protein